jgi:hypothetical protein
MPYEMVTNATYSDSEVRGRMREWKKELVRKCNIFEKVYENREEVLLPVIAAFARKGSMKGKDRAFRHLRKLLGPGAILEGVRYFPEPLAVFSILKPRDSIIIDAPVETGPMQDCVAVNYILAGHLPSENHWKKIGVSEGFWTLEVPDHAIGRAIHRTRELPDKLIRECHLNLLRLPPRLVQPKADHFNNQVRFNVRAGAGGFVCTFRVGEEVSRREYMARVRADTWIAEENRDDQALLTGTGHPGNRLVDSWLTPAPLRRMTKDGEGVRVSVHDSMPELFYRS